MKLTRINFDCIDADGKKSAVVISHTGGVPTVRGLRGKRQTPKDAVGERVIVTAPRVEVVSGFLSPGNLPLASHAGTVLYAEDIN